MNTTTTMAPLQIITTQMLRYGAIFIIVFGSIGCLCSFLTLTAPNLRKNSCAFYFLICAAFEFLAVTFSVMSTFSNTLFTSNFVNTNRSYCKIRAYLSYVIPLISSYMILLASIDRFFASSSSATLRSFSQIKIAYRVTLFTILFSFIVCLHSPIGYDLRPRCSLIGVLATYDTIFFTVWLGVIPHLLMLIFGCSTIINIRRSKRKVQAQPPSISNSINAHRLREQKTNRQLIVMMLAQIILSSMLNLSFTISYTYYILQTAVTFDDRLISLVVISIANLLFYLNYAKSFYVYVLSSSLFRSIFIQRIRSIYQKLAERANAS